MTLSIPTVAQAVEQLTAAGAPFELIELDTPHGPMKAYRNAFATLPELIASARVHGAKEFMVYQGERWDFTRFFAAVDALAARLWHEFGVRPGDRIAIAARNRPEWAIAFAATASVGAVAAPLNSFGQREELVDAIETVEPKLLFCDADRLARIEPERARLACAIVLVDAPAQDGVHGFTSTQAFEPLPAIRLAPDDPALILFTSGTSSKAKGVLSSQRAVCQALFNIDFIAAMSAMLSPQAVARLMQSGFSPSTLSAVPLFHVSGLHAQLLSSLRNGRRLVFMHRWSAAQALDLIRSETITVFNGAPSMVMQLMSELGSAVKDSIRSLSAIGFGGAGLPQRVIEDVMGRMPDSMSGIGFGLTETNGVGSACSGALFMRKPRSSGVVSPIMQIRIIDAEGNELPRGEAGEVCLRGVCVMQEYWRNPQATAEALRDGWFHSGDIGYVDDENFLFIVDRLKDVINRSGEKIAAAEVESCLLLHPEVDEAAVFAVADDETGEAVAAVVVLRQAADVAAEDLRAYVAARLASYKVPQHLHIRHTKLPRTPAGKVLKPALKREYAG